MSDVESSVGAVYRFDPEENPFELEADDYDDHVVSWRPSRHLESTAVELKQKAQHDVNAQAALEVVQARVTQTNPIVNRQDKKRKAAKGAQFVVKGGVKTLETTNWALGGTVLGGATLSSTTGWAAVAVGGLAVGTGPFILLVAATAATVATSALSARAAHRTRKHIKALEIILEDAKRGRYKCGDTGTASVHNGIIHSVLPYIIRKKKAKLARSAFKAVPVIGTAETVRAKVWWLGKKLAQSQGVQRGFNAKCLAEHHCESHCNLTRVIIAELFSVDDKAAAEARFMDERALGSLIELKMKSV